jgi:isoleucyl-tRNA synthetase
MIMLLDIKPHPELQEEGIDREIINRVQQFRKKAGLVLTDEILV